MFKLMTPIVWLTRLLVGAYPQWIGCAPSNHQRIYFANHSSHMDTIVLWSSLPAPLRAKTRPVAAKDYWSKGKIRRQIAINELNVILIDRKRQDKSSDPLEPLRESLSQGYSMIIFPEGTRRPQAIPSEFKSGIWHLAKDFPSVELIPVYIENLHRSMPKGSFIPVPTICSVRFGAPLAFDKNETKQQFLARARDAVIELSEM